ncbi:MAG: serine/threonine protein kinase [Sphaerisporangium sp.]|nr:serine/threonine protein kinase [Sphaerisporangium sp.]
MPEQQRRLLADRYELTTPLGRGTMGTVWRAHDRLLGRDVAVKEIRQDSRLSKEQRDELRERMIREGRTAAKIAHPSVATIHDAILVDGSPWIIMELVEARSLEQVIDEEGPLPPRLVAEIGLDLLGALGAAHDLGILHRDVKPGNVLLTDTGRVVLTDFGIAKAAGDSNITKTGMVIGSPGYTAPERARGDHTGPESDLWSLGATLYFAVEGRPAYERNSVSETLAALMTEQADPATQAGPLRPVLEALLDKDYTKRPTNAEAVRTLRTIAKTSVAAAAKVLGTTATKVSEPTASKTSKPATAEGSKASAAKNSGPAAAAPVKPQPATPAKARPAPRPGPAAKPGGALKQSSAPGRGGAAKPVTGSGSAAGVETSGDAGSEPEVDPNQTMMIIRPKGGLRIPGVQPSTGPSGGPASPARPSNGTASPSRPSNGTASPSGPSNGPAAASRPSTGQVTAASPSPADVDEDSQATMVGRLPPVPAPAPAASPARERPYGKAQPSSEPASDRTRVDPKPEPARVPFQAGAAQAAFAAPARPAPATLFPKGEAPDALTVMDPATPDNGLGTDLFAFQGTAPARGSSPAGMIILVTVALLGLAAIIMLAAAALSNSGSATPTGAKALTGKGSGGVTTTSTVEPGTSPAGTPAPGLRRYIDKTGFIIDLPAKLRGVAKGHSVGFSAGGDVRTVRISRSPGGTADVLGAVKSAEARAVAAGTYPGYKLIRLSATRPAPYPGTDVADWEFTYTAATGPTHVLSRWVAVPGGPSYAIYWSTPETTWKTHRPQLGVVLSSFQPARGDTSGGS